MTREEFETQLGRELSQWENWEKISKVYSRVDAFWSDQKTFLKWYELQGFAASTLMDRYSELIDEHDRLERELDILHNRMDTIQTFLHIS